ncbi:MAG TPA: cytochrome d ubiquinol oxidase subunit II [Actinomycetota bacterium]|nr:cytochrome d ubiquinol oxidase subunit II [Actinomycetota bacterium]
MGLQIFWYIAVALLWTGFFVLEGFDFGVGALQRVIGKDDDERRVVINTIGPVWDGNEVWLIVAGAGIFAAFPPWYATMFSAMYLAMLLLLVALILRGVAFEFRGKRQSLRWRNGWGLAQTLSSLAAPFLIGVALADLLHGLPIDASQEFTGSFWDLLPPYAIFAGLTFVSLCLLHGATFVSLKTTGDVHDRAHRIARQQTIAAGVAVLVFGIWTQVTIRHGAFPDFLSTAAVLAIFAAGWLLGERREGWAFTLTAFAMAATVLTIFIDLYPRVMVSTTDPSYSLTVTNASSSPYALKVMTVVAVIFLPIVLVYQAWSYHVFRKRIGTAEPEPATH